MKITSSYRGEETVLYDGNVLVKHHNDYCLITPRRHHNKREKFIHVQLTCKDLAKILACRIGDKLAQIVMVATALKHRRNMR